MGYYTKHIFICTHQKAAGKVCCANHGGEVFFDYLKLQLRNIGLHGPHRFRVSKTSALSTLNFRIN